MIYLFYGPDTYRSRKKLNEFIASYREKTGTDFNMHRFDAEENDPKTLESLLMGSSLFSSKKVVILYHALASPAAYEIIKKNASLLQSAKNTVIFLWEGNIAQDVKEKIKESAPFIAETKEFKLLSPAEAGRFIKKEAEERGISLKPADQAHLISLGADLWAISNELEKIALFQTGPKNDARGIPAARATTFGVGDTFFSSPAVSLRALLEFFSSGQEDFPLFYYLAGHARTLFTVKSDLEKFGVVSSKHGIHPFVVKKASGIVRAYPAHFFRASLFRFFEEDRKIKTGESTIKDSLIHMLVERRN